MKSQESIWEVVEDVTTVSEFSQNGELILNLILTEWWVARVVASSALLFCYRSIVLVSEACNTGSTSVTQGGPAAIPSFSASTVDAGVGRPLKILLGQFPASFV